MTWTPCPWTPHGAWVASWAGRGATGLHPWATVLSICLPAASLVRVNALSLVYLLVLLLLPWLPGPGCSGTRGKGRRVGRVWFLDGAGVQGTLGRSADTTGFLSCQRSRCFQILSADHSSQGVW